MILLVSDGGLSGIAYSRLIEMIEGSDWTAGGRLPTEEHLSKGLGVSRRVLRIALARLKDEGRISSRQGSGNYVAPRGRDDKATLDFGRLSIRSIADLSACLKFRRVIEVAAAGDAAMNADASDLERLETAIGSFRRSMPGPGRFDDDLDFHVAVSRASRNMFFLATIQGLLPSLRTGHSLSRKLRHVPLNELSRVAGEHARIAQAIRAGDADAARLAMSAHLSAGLSRLFEVQHEGRDEGRDAPKEMNHAG